MRIDLSGVTTAGRSIQGTVYTDASGFYQFANLPPGTYAMYQTQPAGYLDGQESLGSHGGVVGNDQFAGIVLHAGDIGVDYDFGERLPDLSTGDVNGDGHIEPADIDAFYAAVAAGNRHYDLTGEGRVDRDDLDRFVREVLRSTAGDVNLDGRFDSADLILVFVAGQYEDSIPGNSRWATGDWNSDGDFTTDDVVLAFHQSSYVNAATPLPGDDAADTASQLRADHRRSVRYELSWFCQRGSLPQTMSSVWATHRSCRLQNDVTSTCLLSPIASLLIS